MKKENEEYVVYISGGVFLGIYLKDEAKHFTKWKQVKCTLIDYDIEGSDETQICEGCIYSCYPHGNMCRRSSLGESNGKP